VITAGIAVAEISGRVEQHLASGEMAGKVGNRRHVPPNHLDALQAGELPFSLAGRARQRLDLRATRNQSAHQVVAQ
jgi:hypothetical protein